MLTVYRASAGAGKTHKLTGEYLSLLFSSPGAFRRILAVTFTNKATDEMKSRIVDELYHLASGQPSDYVLLLMQGYSLTEREVRKQASRILVELLHDYSAFNISTIDRFFQQTMRAFTREIGLQGGYGIEMDLDLVLNAAVDQMLADLDQPENKELLSWLIRFASDKIEGGGAWSLRREIMALGRELFKESYKVFGEQVREDIVDKQALEKYKENLYRIIHSVESELKSLGERGLRIMDRHGLTPSDFRGGSRSSLFYFERWARGEMKEPPGSFWGLVDKEENFYTKTASADLRASIMAAVEDGLLTCVQEAIHLFENLLAYNTAKEIVRYYYTLGILADLSRQIAVYREEKNVMLIADTTDLLNQVIAGSEAPFIYEKTGTRVDHYMIDEFQDTSAMQWSNFRPLIEESLAHHRDNLIVGDVKQSIYRFRNSDWKLLDEQVQADFSPEQVREETLKENWRSCRHIVEFNNALFTTLPAVLQSFYNEALEGSSLKEEQRAAFFTKIMSAYDQSYQQTPSSLLEKEGHVRIEFLSTEEELHWKEQALDRLPGVLERLQDRGYALKDIAILVRTNLEGAQVAETLLAYKESHPSEPYHYDIISDEALYVSSSSAVRYLISLLRYLKNPEEKRYEQIAQYSYQVLKGNFGEEQPIFPKEILMALQALSRQSLYEISEGIYRLFADDFPANEQVFVQAFLDMVSEFAQKESADLSRFLNWWDESGCRKTIATPDGQNAIRILTVHKSKGLGFKVVIIPFGDWEIDHKPIKPTILWCHPTEAPFNQLHLVPIRYGQSLGNTIFAVDYFQERLHAFIDNLNTLYVAFTRSKEELIVFAPRPKKIKEGTGEVITISSMADACWSALLTAMEDTRNGEPLISLPANFDFKSGVFELGSWWHPSFKPENRMFEEVEMAPLQSISPDDRLHLRLHGKGFFFDDPVRKHGALMHEVLSRIRTSLDIQQAVECYRIAGIIGVEEATMLVDRLTTLLHQPEVLSWYDGSSAVMNEVDILEGKGRSKRPDRVMIQQDRVVVVDYKFGEHPKARYQSQVRNYLKLIRQMGYKKVDGYLWYVELNKIEAVKG